MNWEWLIYVGVAIFGTVGVSLAYYFLVGPKERAAGAAEVVAQQKVKAEALEVGAQAIDKVVIGQMTAVDARTVELKERDPVDIANDIIDRKLRKVIVLGDSSKENKS